MEKKIGKHLSIITDTVKNAKEEFLSFGEDIIDLAVDNETWENVPLVDYATKALKIKDAYKKNKIKRNYAAFINAVHVMNEDDIIKYKDKLFSNKELAEEVTESIFDVITEASKPTKAEVLGNLSVAFAQGKFDIEEYNTLSLMIEACSVAALRAIPKFLKDNNNKPYKSSPVNISNEALLFSMGVANRSGTAFKLDTRGQILAEYGFNITLDKS